MQSDKNCKSSGIFSAKSSMPWLPLASSSAVQVDELNYNSDVLHDNPKLHRLVVTALIFCLHLVQLVAPWLRAGQDLRHSGTSSDEPAGQFIIKQFTKQLPWSHCRIDQYSRHMRLSDQICRIKSPELLPTNAT
jgi:hypothetical protein